MAVLDSHVDLNFPEETSVADATSWEVELMDQTFEGQLLADVDFHTVYEGAVYIDVASGDAGGYEATMTTTHTLNEGTELVTSRSVRYRLTAGSEFTLDPDAFSSISQVRVGEWTAPDGSVVDITQAMLDGPTRIVLTLTLRRTDNAEFGLDRIASSNFAVTFYQIDPRAVPVAGEGMGLKERIDDHLASLDGVTLAAWNEPVLRPTRGTDGAEFKPTISTRYIGTVLLANRRRYTVEVRMIFGPAESVRWSEGAGIQQWDEWLINRLNEVESCYPELLSSFVDYGVQVAGTRRPYIALGVRVVDR